MSLFGRKEAAQCRVLQEKNTELQARIDDITKQLDASRDSIRSLQEKIETLLLPEHRDIALLQKELASLAAKKAEEDTTLGELNQKIAAQQAAQESAIIQHEEAVKTAEEAKDKAEKAADTAAKRAAKLRTLYKSIDYSVQRFFTAPFETELTPDAEAFDDLLSPTVQLKLNCMDVKQLRKAYQDNKKVIEDVFTRYEGRYTTKANAAIYRLMVIALESELQNVLYSLSYGKLENAEASIRAITQKYLTIATDGNQSIVNTMKKFIGEIEYLFLEAVRIEYEYYVQRERIKEEQRAIREQMRQEAEERRILEQQRKQVEKEEQKYRNEMDAIRVQMENANDEKIRLLEARLSELQGQLSSVETKKAEIINLQNGKAGYVYIISNLGAFGDHVFKIGMTRRQEPEDRVRELGDASVPFPFDIHSMIFSPDAVQLENDLHKQLNNCRVNKVNLRKEFFAVSIDALEELVFSLQPSAVFKKTMLAEEYNQSLSISEVPEDHNLLAMDVDEEDEVS
ncbi:MAG: GIY-YIG nuclease family protein [Clostridiaceae bacterium]|nr:GIY-YIG nuclease family protein [Clostridiaceae bacterium]